jgi:hypothetical protein
MPFWQQDFLQLRRVIQPQQPPLLHPPNVHYPNRSLFLFRRQTLMWQFPRNLSPLFRQQGSGMQFADVMIPAVHPFQSP